MDDRGPSNGRDRRGVGRAGERRTVRRTYAVPRAEHRHPVRGGGQARRDNRQGAYIIGFVLVVAALAAFLYVGLNWASGPGRAAALGTPPTPTTVVVAVAVTAVPSPSVEEVQTYIVNAGDNPASIAAQFKITSAELMAANNIDDPQKLQIGQSLKIPTPAPGR